MTNNHNAAQKKHLTEKRKQLRVWVENEKYERFKEAVALNGESIYGVINSFIDSYLQEAKK